MPDDENPVFYVFKGVFGGYEGGFSNTEYYHHNHNYGETELRDLARRQTEDTSRIAECVRIIREETVKHTGLLHKFEREQAIENRSHERER